MKELIEYIIKRIVDKPDSVVVEESTLDENTIEVTIKVDSSDIGKVIGRKGQNINAIRTLLFSVGAKAKHRATLELVE